jgi:phosphinothricin acetyltransferase
MSVRDATGLFDIRPARIGDAEAIARIYNASVLGSAATFQVAPDSVAVRRRWLRGRGREHPVFVVEPGGGGGVVGWAALSAYSVREAWRYTVEDSIYLDASVQGRGLGRVVLGHLLGVARELGLHGVVARIEAGQPASLALHRSMGFAEAGRLREAGWKFGCWHDVVYMQRLL